MVDDWRWLAEGILHWLIASRSCLEPSCVPQGRWLAAGALQQRTSWATLLASLAVGAGLKQGLACFLSALLGRVKTKGCSHFSLDRTIPRPHMRAPSQRIVAGVLLGGCTWPTSRCTPGTRTRSRPSSHAGAPSRASTRTETACTHFRARACAGVGAERRVCAWRRMCPCGGGATSAARSSAS